MDLAKLSNEELETLRWQTRKNISKYHNMQINRKVQLNSCFGFLGNEFSRFYDIRLAEAITKSGQLSIRWIQRKLNEMLNKQLKTDNVDYVIASDTDSVYLNFEEVVKRVYGDNVPDTEKVVAMLDKFSATKIKPFITKSYEELAKQQNAFQQKMDMEREVIADKGIWTAKKRYVLNVWNSEGTQYAEPKIKIMGLEVVRSSTPNVCRDKLKQCIKIMLSGDNEQLIKFVEDFRDEWDKLPIQGIGMPKGLNNLEKYSDRDNIYGFKTPIHVKGGLLFNHFLRKKKLDKIYQKINEGDKVKYVYLKEPNPIFNEVISFNNVMPEEFDIIRYIDRERQFEKAFLKPLNSVAEVIGWNVKHISTLEDFFT